MNQITGGEVMNENVIPLKKTDLFSVYTAAVSPTGEIREKEMVGSAFMRKGDKKFRLKLWLMWGISYFLVPEDNDSNKYVVLIPEEYPLPNGEIRTRWNRIGYGEVAGNFIKIRIHLFSEDLFLCLFPSNNRTDEPSAA